MTFRDDTEAAGWAWNNLHRYRALVAQKMGMVARVEKLEGMLQDEGTIRTTLDQALNIIESADPDLATYPWAQRIAHDARAKFI
jgi:DNA-binding phage protein